MQDNINKISDLIDSGEVFRARHLLVRVAAASSIRREDRLPLARMARRALVPKLGLRLLSSVVRARPKSPTIATPAEKAEYAANLLMTGAHWEATRLLDEVDSAKCSDQLLFLAYAHIFRWEYRESRLLLERYLAEPGLSERQQLVGKINLLAAMVHEQWRPHVVPLREELLSQASSPRFRGNVLELSAQDAIFHSEWEQAEHYLNEAGQLLRQAGGLDQFFVKKWRAILTAKRDGNWSSLERVRRLAEKLQHWESLRDCELYLAAAKKDVSILLKVYMGTPFPSYRNRLFSEWGGPVDLPATFLWGSSTRVLDLNEGSWMDKSFLRPGGLSHRLLARLSSDFYRPHPVGALFSSLYEGEYFNPLTSVPKVYEAIRRLRKELTGAAVPLTLEGSKEGYRLNVGSGMGIRLHRGQEGLPATGRRLVLLKDHYEGGEFTTSQASQVLQMSARSASRLLKEGCDQGELEKRGAGATTTYRFVA